MFGEQRTRRLPSAARGWCGMSGSLWEQAWCPTKERVTDEEFKEIYKQDRAALVVGAALIMTVAAPMILFDRNVLEAGDNYSFEAEGIVRLASVVSLCTAAAGFWIGSYQFLMLNRSPAALAYDVAREISAGSVIWYFLMSPMWYVRYSILALLLAVLAAVEMLQSRWVFNCALLLIVFSGISMQLLTIKIDFAFGGIVQSSGQHTRLN